MVPLPLQGKGVKKGKEEGTIEYDVREGCSGEKVKNS